MEKTPPVGRKQRGVRQSRQDRNEEVKLSWLPPGVGEVLRHKIQGERALQGLGLGLRLELALLIFLNVQAAGPDTKQRLHRMRSFHANNSPLPSGQQGQDRGDLQPSAPAAPSFAERWK